MDNEYLVRLNRICQFTDITSIIYKLENAKVSDLIEQFIKELEDFIRLARDRNAKDTIFSTLQNYIDIPRNQLNLEITAKTNEDWSILQSQCNGDSDKLVLLENYFDEIHSDFHYIKLVFESKTILLKQNMEGASSSFTRSELGLFFGILKEQGVLTPTTQKEIAPLLAALTNNSATYFEKNIKTIDVKDLTKNNVKKILEWIDNELKPALEKVKKGL